MSHRQLILFVLGFTFVMAGCGSLQGSGSLFRDKAKDYHHAKITAPLEVPDSFNVQARQEDFPVPKNVPSEKNEYDISIVPPTAEELKGVKS